MRLRTVTLAVSVLILGAPARRAGASAAAALTRTGFRWHVEHDAASSATISAGESGIELRFHLVPGHPANQFAAAVVALPPDLARFTRLVVRARADRSMRIAIQLRRRDDLGASRWRRTMYLDGDMRTASFDLRDFRPVEPERSADPALATIAALMLGVDTINTRPGTAASVAFADVRLER